MLRELTLARRATGWRSPEMQRMIGFASLAAYAVRDRAILRLSDLAQSYPARISQRAGVELLCHRRGRLVYLDRTGAPHGAGGALDRCRSRRFVLWARVAGTG